MYLECHCFNCAFLFYSLFNFIIHVLMTVNIGLWMYIYMIVENHLPIQGQKYEWRFVCVILFEYKYTQVGKHCM